MAALLFALLVAAVCVRLGFWQLDRLEQRRERNAALREALALPPLRLDSATVQAVARDPDRFLFRRVRAVGAYAPEGEIVLRGRGFRGSPGVNLLTPLRVTGTPWTIAVNRGWAPSSDALSVDPRPLAEGGLREVIGLIQPFPEGVRETRPLEREVEGYPVVTIQRLDSALVRARSPGPLLPVYVQALPGEGGSDDDGGALRRLPIPPMDEGPHLGYAVQWFSFATIAVGGMLVLWIRSRRRP